MKQNFKEFYTSDSDPESIWSSAFVVLDSSVLLNLFRLPVSARDRLLQVLEAIREQLWLPHHVGLEYHRNRSKVQQEQRDRFRQVRDQLIKIRSDFKSKLESLQLRKRHALIDADPLIDRIDSSIDDFLDRLNQTEREQGELYRGENLQSRLADLFTGRVGERPKAAWLEEVQKEGKKRFEAGMPPGYLDAKKGSEATSTAAFSHGGLFYQRKFGDLIVWKQILEQKEQLSSKWLVFVTDDLKDDWWERSGSQRIGPRPELIEELNRETSAEGLLLFSSERFLATAANALNIQLGEDTLAELSTAVKRAETEELVGAEPGFLDHLEKAEEGLEELSAVAVGLTAELTRVEEILDVGSSKLDAASDFRLRKRVMNETAKELNSSAATFSDGVDLFETTLRKIEPGMSFIIDRIDALEKETGVAPDAKTELSELFETLAGTAESARSFEVTLREIPHATTALTNAVQRMADGVARYIEAAERVGRWGQNWE